MRKPCYVLYFDTVYRQVVCTSDCDEESLANCVALDAARHPLPYLPTVYGSHVWYDYVRDFCDTQPPGYRDWSRPRAWLKQRLGGQLNFIQPSASLNEPQAQWVGLYPNPTHYRRKCPIHKVQKTLASQKGIRLKIAAGGVWVCHRYDTDPYPSRPHAHNMETGEKLHLGSGEIFRPGSRIAKGRLAEKHLHVIQDTISKKWPDVTLPSMLP